MSCSSSEFVDATESWAMTVVELQASARRPRRPAVLSRAMAGLQNAEASSRGVISSSCNESVSVEVSLGIQRNWVRPYICSKSTRKSGRY